MKHIVSLPVSELKSALTGLGKIIKKRNPLPVLGNIKVQRDTSGKVHLHAADIDAFVSTELNEPQTGAPVGFLVPFEPLQKAVKGLGSKEEIHLLHDGTDSVTIETQVAGQQVRQSHNTPKLDEWPDEPVVTTDSIPVDEGFRAALKEALECSSRDDSRRVINGACIDASDEHAHYLVGTNGRLLYSANSFHFEGLEGAVIIPNHKILSWKGMDAEDGELAVQPGEEKDNPAYVRLRSGNWTYTAKQVEGPYPNWKQIYPNEAAKAVVTFSDEAVKTIADLLPKLPVTNEVTDPIVMRVTAGTVSVAVGETACPIDETQVAGDDCTVALKRESVLKALGFGLNKLAIFDELTPAVFSNEGRRLAIAPVHLAQAVTDTPEQKNEETTDEPAESEQEEASSVEEQEQEAGDKPAPESAVRETISQVENIRSDLRDVVRDLTQTLSLLKHVEREKKATEKEIRQIKSKLREIQSMEV